MHQFELVHIGLNTTSPEEATQTAQLLCRLFNLGLRHGNKSEFAGDYFECMKAPFLGTHGHIAMRTEHLEDAMKELEQKGFCFHMDTAAYSENGKIKNIYLADEVAGFAIHIMNK